MEVAFISCWQTTAKSFGDLCVLGPEWFYQREMEGPIWDWITNRTIFGLVRTLAKSVAEVYNYVATLGGHLQELDLGYLAEALGVLGG